MLLQEGGDEHEAERQNTVTGDESEVERSCSISLCKVVHITKHSRELNLMTLHGCVYIVK